ncbi:MAG: hypothetical protein ACRC1P_11375 [Cellulosilyticaceae bacterium]
MSKVNRIGEIRLNNQGSEMTIIRYVDCKNIDVKFKSGYVCKNKTYSCFINGRIKDKMFPSVHGVGFLGDGEFAMCENKKETMEGKVWANIMHRCYDKGYAKRRPTYIECTVCDEWHNFQNFAKWYNDNKWTNTDLIPDKDILCHGRNKVYSPDTVLLVDKRINMIFIKSDARRGRYPIGVTFNKKKFISQCCTFDGETICKRYLGSFDTPEEAFQVYKLFKENYIKQVADEYKAKYPNFPEKLYRALYEYEVDIND